MSRTRISVVIPYLNQPDLLALCLQRIPQAPRGADLVEILVVDNGSRPELSAEAAVAAHPAARLLHQPDRGPGPARNMGAQAATGDLIAFTDSDCLPEPDWLDRVAAAFAADPEARIVGGSIRIARADPPRATPIEAFECVYSFRARDYIEREGYAATANMTVRAPAWHEIGPFGGIDIAEDIEWGKRATAMGERIRYVEDIRVQHPARPRFEDLARKWDRLILHQWTMKAGGLKGRLKWALKALALAVSPLLEIPRIAAAREISGMGERWSAFRIMARIRLYRVRLMLRLLFGDDLKAGEVWNQS